PMATTEAKLVHRISDKKAKASGAKSSRKRCSASSSGAGPTAQASAPPAPGCTRMNGSNGVLVLPDGTTLTITSPSQGVMNFTVSGGPTGTFTGTIFAKGGPEALGPGTACSFNGVTMGTCTTPINPNNQKPYGLSHVDACPGAFVPPGTPGTQGGGGQTGGQQREQERRKQQKQKRQAAAERAEAARAAEAVVAAQAGLPVTGLPVIWLVLAGGMLVASGLTLRRLT
ncbi:MAG: hypothetical protein ACRDJ9_31355, partial [Dehalococcoidia bacterium]